MEKGGGGGWGRAPYLIKTIIQYGFHAWFRIS